METFEHLGFFLQLSEGTPLSQAATFFANSDPDMPAAPVPAALVHDWVLQHIASALEFMAEKTVAKENSQHNAFDPDVTMSDAVTNTRIHSSSPTGSSAPNYPGYYRNASFVEGCSKTSVVKQASDLKGHSIKVCMCFFLFFCGQQKLKMLAPLYFHIVSSRLEFQTGNWQ
jgi:TBCC domain-containing protein 1